MSWRVPPPLAIDFSGRRRWPSVPGWGLLVFGLLAVAGVLHEYDTLETQRAEEERALARLRRQADLRPASRAQVAVSDTEARPALALASALGRPWPVVLDHLARAADDPGVAILEVDLDGARGQVRITGEARNLPEVFALVRRLENAGPLAGVRLVSYAFRTEGSVPVVGFSLHARWPVPS
ncbi:PilN domain-containing protein [Zoogloea sp.]|uniref:PilN domain-containing protein n=1 Tax=Zoogloea sp. TaxID=49181 RepID=UPI002613FB3A|nr:PilN domain-containing protein [Zoogloea sp.]MDD3352660.1 PilN domain-containing protein [Zoogloea sp.]